MEWVRVGKRSKWRLIAGHPEILTRGRYVYAPPGTAHYPGFHNFWSRNWTRQEADPWPALGEYQGATTVDLGDLATPYPPARLVGGSDCIAAGERFPLPVIPGYALFGGFDTRCFALATLPPADVRIDVNARNWQLEFAILSDLLYDHPELLPGVAQTLFGPSAIVSVVPDSDSFIPGSLIVRLPTQTIVVISGTSNHTQLALQILAEVGGLANVGPFETNTVWWTAATYIHSRIVAAGVDPSLPITLTGHSYGGAVATLLAAQYHVAQPDREIQLLTFGMPKPGGPRLATALGNITQTHIANEGDPVAFLPVGEELMNSLLLVAPLWMQLQWVAFVRPKNQLLLRPDGTMRLAAGDLIDYALLLQIVADTIFHNPYGVFTPHEIKSYILRLAMNP